MVRGPSGSPTARRPCCARWTSRSAPARPSRSSDRRARARRPALRDRGLPARRAGPHRARAAARWRPRARACRPSVAPWPWSSSTTACGPTSTPGQRGLPAAQVGVGQGRGAQRSARAAPAAAHRRLTSRHRRPSSPEESSSESGWRARWRAVRPCTSSMNRPHTSTPPSRPTCRLSSPLRIRRTGPRPCTPRTMSTKPWPWPTGSCSSAMARSSRSGPPDGGLRAARGRWAAL